MGQRRPRRAVSCLVFVGVPDRAIFVKDFGFVKA
jgi:hypothetical protein